MTDLDKRITDACHRIEELYYETDGKCYVSFSGGKDSTVLLALIKLCEEVYTIPVGGIPAVFINTGIEMGCTVDFVKWVKENYYSNVQTVRPTKSFDWVIKNSGKPIKSKLRSDYLNRWQRGTHSKSVMNNLVYGVTANGGNARQIKLADKDVHMLSDDFQIHISPRCCNILKKAPAKKYAHENQMKGQMTGLRQGEGGAREMKVVQREKDTQKICTSVDKKGFIRKSPLVDWSDDDLENFIETYEVPLSKAYTEYGFHRTGCMLCPFSRQLPSDLKYLYDHEPNRYKASMHWLKDVYIAQNVVLPFDEAYERERERMWWNVYEPMRQEMLRKYRPNSKLIKSDEQMNLFQLGD